MYNELSKEELIKLLKLSDSKLHENISELNVTKSKLNETKSMLHEADLNLTKATIKIGNLESKIYELQSKFDEILKKYEKELESKKIAIARQFCKKAELNSTAFNEVEQEASETIEQVREKHKRGRKTGFSMKEKFEKLDANIIREIINIPYDQTNCPECDCPLTDHGTNATYKIEIIPAKIKIIEFNYATKNCHLCNQVFKNDYEQDTYPNSHLTPSLGSELLTNKYILGIPLYRMEEYYFKLGLPLRRQSMADYMIKLAVELEPLYFLMKKHLIENSAKVIHCDETVLNVIKTTDEQRSNCYMWVYATSFFSFPILLYDFQESRQKEHIEEFLKGYNGYIVSDGYQVYRNLNNIDLAACYAHARRKFFDIVKTLTNEQKKKSKALEAVNIIDRLFKVEAEYKENRLTPSEIYARRQKNSLPIVDEYEKFLDTISCEETSALGNAVYYSKNLMPNLRTFLKDGHIEISNNLAERAIKPFVIARKNFLFSYSLKGALASAINFSVIQTARANGLDVRKYLEYLFKELPNIKHNDFENYLPWKENITEKFKVVIASR